MMKKLLCLLGAVILLAGLSAAGAEGQEEKGAVTDGDNCRVFYEIFVGSFSDSNGDGVGDLRGIISRMDYLTDLGIEGIWLTPVFLSPSYHKYDVTDYYQIDPAFGTEEDLKELIRRCHERNIKLILDLPLNHTGNENRWYLRFLEAHREGRTADRYYHYYTWYPEDGAQPANAQFMTVGEGLRVEANFSDHMPELNFDSPLVRQSVLKIGKYYLALGADGFRFDAAKYLYLNDHDRNTAFWKWYIGELKKDKPDLYAVAEVWDQESVTNRYAGAVDCFRFSTSGAEGLLANTAKGGNVNRLTADTGRYLKEIRAVRPDAMNLFFLSNHDTDRAAGYLTVASGRMQMAANLYILSPGSPFIYYGEEIGLRGSRGGANTDANRRLAMRWGDGDTVKDPEGSDYDAQTEETVRSMNGSGKSLLNYYRQLLKIRRENPEIARGEYQALDFPESKAGGFFCTWQGKTAGVFHNTGRQTETLDLRAFTDPAAWRIEAVIGKKDASLENGMLIIGSQTSVVLRQEEDRK